MSASSVRNLGRVLDLSGAAYEAETRPRMRKVGVQ
jgi:hypothetical protein